MELEEHRDRAIAQWQDPAVHLTELVIESFEAIRLAIQTSSVRLNLPTVVCSRLSKPGIEALLAIASLKRRS